ncbi:MAG TPA: acyltransferase [Rhizomicrobium sp.]|nr:acyltransferase [Rhizomicrobium sp.]
MDSIRFSAGGDHFRVHQAEVPLKNPGAQLLSLQVGRAFAAMAVVLFHANAAASQYRGPTFAWMFFGQHGVDFFFVLSGFIIFFAHRHDIGRPEAATGYLLKRFIRLYPILWIVVLAYGIPTIIFGGHNAAGASLSDSLLLYPSLARTLPTVVWTLRHEVLFYAAFVVLIINVRAGIVLFVAWAAVVFVQLLLISFGHPIKGTASLVLSTYQIDFIFGAAVAYSYFKGRLRMSLSAGLISLAMTLSAFWMIRNYQEGGTSYTAVTTAWVTLVLGAGFGGLLLDLLSLEGRVFPSLLVLIGNASYSIYLIHTAANVILQRIAAYFPHGLLAFGAGQAFLFVGGVSAGVALHLFVEKPVVQGLRDFAFDRKRKGPEALAPGL